MTDTVTQDDQLTEMTVDANAFARAYLAVAAAASDDDDRPVLWRATSIEFYESRGLALTTTDGYALLRAWVAGDWDEGEPTLDEAPDRTAVVLDPAKRGASLMKYLVQATSGKDAPPMSLRLLVGPAALGLDAQTMSFDGMDKVCVLFEVPEQERLKLATFEADWVDWRPLVAGFKEAKTGAIALGTDRLAQVSAAAKAIGTDKVDWHFGGIDNPARIDMPTSIPHVTGLVMPMRMFEPAAEGEPPEGD